MRRRFVSVLLLLLLALPSPEAAARKALPEDLGAVLEFDRARIDVKADGLYRLEREYQVRIVNDHGRESQGEQTLPFNARATKIRILAAKTINDGKAADVPKANIETREVGENIKIFDTQKQIVVSFPHVRPESRLYLKYEMEFTEVPLEGHFSYAQNFEGSLINENSVEIRSAKPLHAFIHDPGKYFVLKEGRDGKAYTYSLKTVKPLDLAVIQEDDAVTDFENAELVSFSSEKDWVKFGAGIPASIEALASAPLPEAMKKIRDRVDTGAPIVDRLNQVTALMSEEFRYFGDWRRRNGGHMPRSLKEIAESRYGDCKDLSLAAVAIYRALGFKAHQAWIFRSPGVIDARIYTLPVDNFFNHAVARVEAEGKVYWIDPTNPVSFAQGVPVDIAGRPAFVLDTAAARLDATPPLRSNEEWIETDMKYDLLKDMQVQVKGTVHLRGRAATGMTMSNFFNSPDNVNYELVRYISANDRVVSFEVGDFDRRSRVVKNMDIPLKYLLEDTGLRTTAGIGFPLFRDGLIDRLMVETRNRMSAIWMDTPRTIVSKIEIANVKKIGSKSLDCRIQSRWATLRREVKASKSGIRITDHLEALTLLIPAKEMSSPEFAKFQTQVRACFLRSALILERRL